MYPQEPNVPTPEITKVEDPVKPQIQDSKFKIPSDNHWVSILAMAIFVIFALGVVVFLYYQNQQLKQMLANYQPTPIASPTPTVTPDPTSNWKTINAKYWTFKVPESWFYIKCLSGNDVILGPNLSKEFRDTTSDCNFGIRDFLSVSRITSKFTVPVTTSPDQSGIYTVVSDKKDILIDGQRAIEQTEKVYGNQMEGTHLVVYVQGNGFTDELTFWDINTNVKKDTIDQILSTFSFTTQKSVFKCPSSGWVDCMPGTTAKPECSTEAMKWYKVNCPDFKGGAY